MGVWRLAVLGVNETLLDGTEGGWVVTILGVTELRRATLASHIRRRLLDQEGGLRSRSTSTRVLTVLGSTTVHLPLLATEMIEMIQLRDGGVAPRERLLELGRVILAEEAAAVGWLSLLGSTQVSRRSPQEECASLREAIEAGLLPARLRALADRIHDHASTAPLLALQLLAPDELALPDPYRTVRLQALGAPEPEGLGSGSAHRTGR